MEARFIHAKPTFWQVLTFLCGVLSIGLYVFLHIVDPECSDEIIIFLILGIITCLCIWFVWRMNRRAFFRVNPAGIDARYPWFGRLECGMEEVAFVLAQVNTLSILLKNGKRHVIMGLEDPWTLATYIRMRIYAPESEPPDALQSALDELKAQRKKNLRWLFGCIGGMFLLIFVAVFLTDGKDLPEFDRGDWTVFCGMVVAELVTLVVMFRFALGSGSYLLPMEQLTYRLRGSLLLSTPLPAGNVRQIYIDVDHSHRVMVCGFPNEDEVYDIVQTFGPDLRLVTVDMSMFYEEDEDVWDPTLFEVTDIF